MSKLIRIVEGETFDKKTADIIAKTEPEKVFQVGENEYAYERHIELTKLPNGKYQYTITAPDGKEIKSNELSHPFIFPKKVTYFAENGQKQKSYAFVDIYGSEHAVKREYNSFLKVTPKSRNGKVVITPNPSSTDGNFMLDILLNEINAKTSTPSEDINAFADYLYVYSTEGRNLFLDEDAVECDFANDEIYNAVVKEERRRWAEEVRPKLNANVKYKTYSEEKQNEYVMKLPETKAYLARKKQIAALRAAALNKAGVE